MLREKREFILKENWKFNLGDEKEAFQKDFIDNEWENVYVPHDWSVTYPMSRSYSSGTGYVKGGIGWYRKSFHLPLELKGKKVFIVFDGVYKNSQVWCNGYYMGKRNNGYIYFKYDISEQVSFGEIENIISVKVSHEDIADSRWFTGSGISRKVYIVVENEIYPEEGGIFFKAKNISKESAEVQVENEIVFDKDNLGNVIISNIILDKDERIVAKFSKKDFIKEKMKKKFTIDGVIDNPKLWSVNDSYLYTLKTEVICEEIGETYIIDEQKVGIRKIIFDKDKGFFLNGEKTTLKGVCLHDDGGALGAAMTKDIWRRRLVKLKDVGCNAIRMSHNPHMPELYDLCDEMGFLVIDEAFDEWEAPKNKWYLGHNVYPPKHEGYAEDFPEWSERDLKALVKKNRNHPSIIMWSIGNEIDYPNDPYCHPLFECMTGNNDKNKPENERIYNPNKPNMERLSVIARSLSNIVKACDLTRPVTAALAFPELSTQIGYIDSLDVVGYNYKEHLYENDHKRFPDKIFLGSENGHSYDAWKAVVNNEFISGQFLWTGIDYLGECVGWPFHGSQSGLLTTAGFEKTDYYRRKSYWSEEPMIHIVTARKGDNDYEWKEMNESWNYIPGEEILVRCYTNVKNPILLLNGKIQREFIDTSNKGYLTWNVIFEEGVLEARAGQANHILETVGAETTIKLKPIVSEDIIQIELEVLDSKNRNINFNKSRIDVVVEGAGRLVAMDNGDLRDVTDYTANYRDTYKGKLTIYVRRVEAGDIVVTASNPYLKESRIII